MKLRNVCVLILSMIILAGCGSDTQLVYVPVPGPAITPTPTDSNSIASLVADENAYRTGLGQTALSLGLSCTLYTITGGQYIQNDATHTPTLTGVVQVATYLYDDVFNQPNASASAPVNVLPAALQANPAYANLIKLSCQGQIVVTDTNFYDFNLSSDDGSVLYLDGARLIDNDGNHGITSKDGSKYLRKGVHAFRLDFAQTGGGNQALILTSNGSLISGAYLYH